MAGEEQAAAFQINVSDLSPKRHSFNHRLGVFLKEKKRAPVLRENLQHARICSFITQVMQNKLRVLIRARALLRLLAEKI